MLPTKLFCPPFDVDSKKCPATLKIMLREDIRRVFKYRREFVSYVLSNVALDVFIENWWSNHVSLIRAASIRPEWDWSSLSLLFDSNVMRPVNFERATIDFFILITRVVDGSPLSGIVGHRDAATYNYITALDDANDYEYYDRFLTDSDYGLFMPILGKIFLKVFSKVVLEDNFETRSTTYTEKDAKLSYEKAMGVKEFISAHTEEGVPSVIAKVICERLGINILSFKKLPEILFNYANTHREKYVPIFNELIEMILNYEDYFVADIFKSIGANQVANGVGPVKTTLVNKLVKLYNEWLTALCIGCRKIPFTLTQNTFEEYVKTMKESIKFYSDEPFKVRREGIEGFILTHDATFEQVFARLQESVRGTLSKESFVVSFHPCDMITCSLGYNWSSCQSFINMFGDFPRGYGCGSNYSGMYNRGNFQFASGNGFIAYVPYEKLEGVPQYLWAKEKRCLLWVNNELNCMRQNFFYPGKPTDCESIAFAKVIREYIQDVVAPFNFSNGTIDWKSCSKQVRHVSQLEDTDFTKFTEVTTYNSGRYDDPILTVAYLKGTENGQLIYAADFPSFDVGRLGNTFFKKSRCVCKNCGKDIESGTYCSKCSGELVEHNGSLVHPNDLVNVKVGDEMKSFNCFELTELSDFVLAEDGTHVPFKSAFKVLMPSGVKYFKTLPTYVKQCKVCNEYFHSSYMIGDVCVEHVNSILDNGSGSDVSIDSVIESFLNGSLSFSCNDENALKRLLDILSEKKVMWQGGKIASAFVPSSRVSRGRYLQCSNRVLLLSSQPRKSVVKLNKLFEKGGK